MDTSMPSVIQGNVPPGGGRSHHTHLFLLNVKGQGFRRSECLDRLGVVQNVTMTLRGTQCTSENVSKK